MSDRCQPVLVLGAGINGCAIARELLLSGVDVWLVDQADLASGATAGSSRLIHGGLRYLEYGELDLVRESLEERTRLFRLAPQFVHPLRLWIPSSNRLGGTIAAIGRFFGWRWWPQPVPSGGRGAWLISTGLQVYDAYARDDTLAKHKTFGVPTPGAPAVDPRRYRWLSAYYDGQVVFPERLLVAMLADAQAVANERGHEFRLFTYHQASRRGEHVDLRPLGTKDTAEVAASLRPSLIVNATGAWVDETLARLDIHSQRLMGGTKGSHLFTFSSKLRQALAGQGIYAEAADGRPIFIIPLADTILVGTTDERFEDSPSTAQASQHEIEYLIDAVNQIVPEARLSRADVNFHYSAVRPLPFVDAASTAAITRRHWLVENDSGGIPLISVVGGKLTTMRSLAQSTAATVLTRLNRKPIANSQERIIPGGENYPASEAALESAWTAIAERNGLSRSSVAATWRLYGTLTESILSDSAGSQLLADTVLPHCLVTRAVEREWARSLADLVERRLMLLYHQRLTRACLEQLARALARAGLVAEHEITSCVEAEIERLKAHYGKIVE